MRLWTGVLLVLCGLRSGSAAAEDAVAPLPPWRVTHETLAAVRLNPIGLNLEVRPAVRRRLYASTSAIGRDNFVDLGPTLAVTPAFARGGASMRVQPVAMLRLDGRVEGIRYFGGFDQVQSWPTAAGAVWDDATQDTRGEAGMNYGTGGLLASGEVLLRAKVASIAAISQTRVVYTDVDLQAGDTVLYDITYDALVANQGLLVAEDLSVVWVPEARRLTTGVRWSAVHALHPEAPDSTAAATMHRAGPLVAWRVRGEEGAGVSNLSVFSIAQWWLVHPYRTGQTSSAAVPYVVLGVSMSGEMLPWAQ